MCKHGNHFQQCSFHRSFIYIYIFLSLSLCLSLSPSLHSSLSPYISVSLSLSIYIYLSLSPLQHTNIHYSLYLERVFDLSLSLSLFSELIKLKEYAPNSDVVSILVHICIAFLIYFPPRSI